MRAQASQSGWAIGHLALLALVLAACHNFWPQPQSGSLSSQSVGQETRVSGLVAAPDRGRLSLSIRWPERDYPGFRAAVIPKSTNALAIVVKDSAARVLAERLVSREPSVSTVSVAIELEAASNVSVVVRAYRDALPDRLVAIPIAQGTAAGITIQPAADNRLTIMLAPLFAPTIAAVSLNGGPAGETLTLTGTNLAVLGEATPSVFFNGTAALVTPVDATTLRVVVPAGAATGRVVMISDGVPSVSNVVYWVADSLAIAAPKAIWDPSPSGSRVVLWGQTLAFTANPGWVYRASESAATYGTPPTPTWALGNAAVGSVDGAGILTAGTFYASGSVSATLGQLKSPSLVAIAENLQVSISPASGVLGPWGESSINFRATSTLSDGATFSGFVDFVSSDPASFSVDAIGLAKPISGYGYGALVARSQMHPTRLATASVRVTPAETATLVGFAAGEKVEFSGRGDGFGDAYQAAYDIAVKPLALTIDASTSQAVLVVEYLGVRKVFTLIEGTGTTKPMQRWQERMIPGLSFDELADPLKLFQAVNNTTSSILTAYDLVAYELHFDPTYTKGVAKTRLPGGWGLPVLNLEQMKRLVSAWSKDNAPVKGERRFGLLGGIQASRARA